MANDQGDSEACVRFAIGRAVANFLFKRGIDIEESHITIALVQVYKAITPINPKKFDSTVLYLQDKENNIEKMKNKNWWKVRI